MTTNNGNVTLGMVHHHLTSKSHTTGHQFLSNRKMPLSQIQRPEHDRNRQPRSRRPRHQNHLSETKWINE